MFNCVLIWIIVACSLLLCFLFYLALCWVIWAKLHTLWKTMLHLNKLSFIQFQVSPILLDDVEFVIASITFTNFPLKMCTLYEIILSAGGAFWPVLIIANVAALIASRAMTTATFSCIKQSMALGCFPRLKIVHTSRKFMGQIYIPVINWFLLVVCLVSICSISSINEIGNAYGNFLYPLLQLNV